MDDSFVQAPDRQGLALYVAVGSAIAFAFGWHVHEKATWARYRAIAELDFCRTTKISNHLEVIFLVTIQKTMGFWILARLV